MTREEAYNRIDAIIAKHEIDDEYVTITNCKDYDALRMARKILEPKTDTWSIKDVANTFKKHGLIVEQEPCEDAVSRQYLIDIATEDGAYDYVSAQEIANAPSVNPQPKTGHWIEHPEIETSAPEYLMFYECSECGDERCFCKSDIHKKHFCNNCGAKMVEPQERSDKE